MTLLRFGADTPAKWWVGDDEVAIAWHGDDEIWRASSIVRHDLGSNGHNGVAVGGGKAWSSKGATVTGVDLSTGALTTLNTNRRSTVTQSAPRIAYLDGQLIGWYRVTFTSASLRWNLQPDARRNSFGIDSTSPTWDPISSTRTDLKGVEYHQVGRFYNLDSLSTRQSVTTLSANRQSRQFSSSDYYGLAADDTYFYLLRGRQIERYPISRFTSDTGLGLEIPSEVFNGRGLDLHDGRFYTLLSDQRTIASWPLEIPAEQEGTLTVTGVASGRDENYTFLLTDPNGIRSVTSVVALTARDGNTASLTLSRVDANTFRGNRTSRNNRWLTATAVVTYVDTTSGDSHTITQPYTISL